MAIKFSSARFVIVKRPAQICAGGVSARRGRIMRLSLTTIAATVVTLATVPALAGSELDTALANGGNRLNSDQIADLIVGKRVTARAGDKTFEFYYDPANVLSGALEGGGVCQVKFSSRTFPSRSGLRIHGQGQRPVSLPECGQIGRCAAPIPAHWEGGGVRSHRDYSNLPDVRRQNAAASANLGSLIRLPHSRVGGLE